MDGRRSSEARVEPSSGDGAYSRAFATRSGAVSGSSTGTARKRRQTPDRGTALGTRTTVRLLTLKGLDPSEAANLTAYLCGIPVTEARWELRQVNRLLFLRALRRRGDFGPSDGAPQA
jgi:hypothetical protein